VLEWLSLVEEVTWLGRLRAQGNPGFLVALLERPGEPSAPERRVANAHRQLPLVL